jgi:DNA-binding LytR/AlgR family response regulator
MRPLTFFAFIQNANLEKKVIDCLSKFKTIHFYGFVNQRVDFLERMSQFRPEILILDLTHHKNDESELLDIIHKPPIILGIVSPKENPNFWLDKGLFDVIPSQFNSEQLIRKIFKIIKVISDINQVFLNEPMAAENPIPYKPCRSSNQKENDSLLARFQKVTSKIKFHVITVITKEKKILAIETASNQLFFHESTIKETSAKLPQEYLLRINNATIINLNYVDKIQKNVAYIDSRQFIISRSYHFQFKSAFEALHKK